MDHYKDIQLIAYRVPTDLPLPAGNACDVSNLALCAGLEEDLPPLLKKLSDDARSRVTRMLAVIDRAMQSKALAKDETTLKVFMAPEFYFRPQKGDAARSYTEDEMHAVLAILRRVFTHKKLVGWLFVPGTIVWNLKGQNFLDDLKLEASTAALKKIAKQDIVINTAMVGVGGHGLTNYDKLHYSGADNIDAKYRALLNKEKKTPKDNDATTFDLNVLEPQRPLFSEYFELMRKRNRNQCVIGVGDNRWFGIEVCLDHELRVLKNAYRDFAETWPKNPPPRLDFQLLTACGMRVLPNNVTVGEDQYVFRNDGISCVPYDWAEPYDPSEIQFVTKADDNGVLETTTAQNPATKDFWTKLNDVTDWIELSGDLKLDATGVDAILLKPVWDKSGKSIESLDEKRKPLDTWFPQQVAVYRPLPFPND